MSQRSGPKRLRLGPKSREWLSAVGLDSDDRIRRVGAVESYRRAKRRFPQEVSLNLLWGLQAALMGVDWRDLPDALERKLHLEASKEGPH